MLTLHPSRWRVAMLLLGSAAFVAAGVWMVREGRPFGWAAIGFFGLGILVGVVQFLPGSSRLRIDATGFSATHVFRTTSVRWADVASFQVVVLRRRGSSILEMVGFDYAPGYAGHRLARRVNTVIGGCESALPDTYGMSAGELASLMNERLERARARGDASSTRAGGAEPGA